MWLPILNFSRLPSPQLRVKHTAQWNKARVANLHLYRVSLTQLPLQKIGNEWDFCPNSTADRERIKYTILKCTWSALWIMLFCGLYMMPFFLVWHTAVQQLRGTCNNAMIQCDSLRAASAASKVSCGCLRAAVFHPIACCVASQGNSQMSPAKQE